MRTDSMRFPIHPLKRIGLLPQVAKRGPQSQPNEHCSFRMSIRPDRIVPFGLFSGFAPGPNVGNRAAKADLENVSAGPQRLLYVETVRDEHILRPADVLSVETDAGDSVGLGDSSICS